MISVSSISGGQTSAYMAVNYPTDYNVFSLVRIEDINCKYPDEILRKRVEDRIQAPFIATSEDDKIIKTIFDLEQFMGREITWVTGITFDEVVRSKGGWLPNKLHRYCTTWLKLYPIFYWWHKTIGYPCVFNIGYRANEKRRVIRMRERLNSNGCIVTKATFERHENGNNKWVEVEWEMPRFPLYDNGIYRDHIVEYWKDKPVEFAQLNNCVMCFHRNPLLLKKMATIHPNKMEWAASKEQPGKGTWRSDVSYRKIIDHELQFELSFDDFDDCDSGYCGI